MGWEGRVLSRSWVGVMGGGKTNPGIPVIPKVCVVPGGEGVCLPGVLNTSKKIIPKSSVQRMILLP